MRLQSTGSLVVTERRAHHLFAEPVCGRPPTPQRAATAVLWPPAAVPSRPFLWPAPAPSLERVAPASPAALLWGAWPPGSSIDAAPYGPYWCDVRAELAGFAWRVTDSWTGTVIASGRSAQRQTAMAHAGLAAVIADIPEPLSVSAARAFGDWS